MFELMATTEYLARMYGTTPFDVMNQDAEHVIMVINYLLEKAEKPSGADALQNERKTEKRQKDNFWDF